MKSTDVCHKGSECPEVSWHILVCLFRTSYNICGLPSTLDRNIWKFCVCVCVYTEEHLDALY